MTSMLALSTPEPTSVAVNSTDLLPGRTCGQRCAVSPCVNSVTGVGVPPAEEIRDKPPFAVSVRMMLPSSPQLPLRLVPPPVSQRGIAAPPSTEIFSSFPPAKNPTHCPSGEKNVANTPCGPEISDALG